jgi:hypothetical protein
MVNDDEYHHALVRSDPDFAVGLDQTLTLTTEVSLPLQFLM